MIILEAKNLRYKSNNDNIIDGISIKINKGDSISIVGASGSGKSTFLKLFADLIEVSSGELYYKGKNYKDYDPLELKKSVSYLIQTPYLFGETVYTNLVFPFKIRKEVVDEDRIKKLLKEFNLSKDILHRNVNLLSGGEKQRISIIRTLIYKPEVLLLDEATSALDKTNEAIVEKYIKKLNKEKITVIWITHSLEQSYSIFNKRITLEKGKIKNLEVLL